MRLAPIIAVACAVAAASVSFAAGGGAGGVGSAGGSGGGAGSAAGAGTTGGMGGGMTAPGGADGGTGITAPSGTSTPGQRTEQLQHETGEKARSMERQLQEMDRRGKLPGEALPSPGSEDDSIRSGSPPPGAPGSFDKPLGDVEKDVDRLEKR